jgi:hypothetical protein
MSTTRLLRAARLHAGWPLLALLLPWWLLLHVVIDDMATRRGLLLFHLIALLVVVGATAAIALRRDRRWLARRLDALRPEFEDSSDLLWQDRLSNALARLQRARLQSRVAMLRARDLRLDAPWAAIVANAMLVALLTAVIAWPPWLPTNGEDSSSTTPIDIDAQAPAAPQLVARQLSITPPDYTGLPQHQTPGLDARAAEGSELRWTLRFDRPPQTVALRFHDGEELPLAAAGSDTWQATRTVDRAMRYRLLIDGEVQDPNAAASRLDVIPDMPPRIVVSAPQQTLTLLDSAAALQLAFEASDDYGLGAVELSITLAQGDGEQVQVSERSLPLRGAGDARLQRFRQRIDPAALGFARGDDLILRISVADTRRPAPQVTRSPAYILRWPSPAGLEGDGVEGLVQRALPAYFRSQRQIIIDSEALLEQQPALTRDDFVERSDTIGVDQRLLRLRYGQFLGEEAESGNTTAAPTAGRAADGTGTDAARTDREHDARDDHGHHDHDHRNHAGHAHDDSAAPDPHAGHDHGDADPTGATRADADALIMQFGHVHDRAEAATLFDPATRELLRSALREMWQSELHLRQGNPAVALPYQYRALDFIKRVQQANRVYLARVGLELPPIDPERRLSGDRSGVRARPDPITPATSRDMAVEHAWRAIAPLSPASEAERSESLVELLAWLRENEARSSDPLALFEAVEAVQLRPGCTECTERLRAHLWPLRPLPATGADLRTAPTAQGRTYLDALQEPVQ